MVKDEKLSNTFVHVRVCALARLCVVTWCIFYTCLSSSVVIKLFGCRVKQALLGYPKRCFPKLETLMLYFIYIPDLHLSSWKELTCVLCTHTVSDQGGLIWPWLTHSSSSCLLAEKTNDILSICSKSHQVREFAGRKDLILQMTTESSYSQQ